MKNLTNIRKEVRSFIGLHLLFFVGILLCLSSPIKVNAQQNAVTESAIAYKSLVNYPDGLQICMIAYKNEKQVRLIVQKNPNHSKVFLSITRENGENLWENVVFNEKAFALNLEDIAGNYSVLIKTSYQPIDYAFNWGKRQEKLSLLNKPVLPEIHSEKPAKTVNESALL